MNLFLLILFSASALGHANLLFKSALASALDFILALIAVSLWWWFVYMAGVFSLLWGTL